MTKWHLTLPCKYRRHCKSRFHVINNIIKLLLFEIRNLSLFSLVLFDWFLLLLLKMSRSCTEDLRIVCKLALYLLVLLYCTANVLLLSRKFWDSVLALTSPVPICTPGWREKHCEPKVSHPRTQYNDPSQISNPDCFTQSPAC